MSSIALGLHSNYSTIVTKKVELSETLDDPPGLLDVFKDPSGARNCLAVSAYYGSVNNPWLEHILNPSQRTVNTITSIDIPDAIASIRDVFGLNTKELAQVCLVARPTIYNWSDGSPVKAENRARVAEIHSLAQKWMHLNGCALGSLTREPLNEGFSLLDLLTQQDLDAGAIEPFLENIYSKLNAPAESSSTSARELSRELGFTALSEHLHRRTVKNLSLKKRRGI